MNETPPPSENPIANIISGNVEPEPLEAGDAPETSELETGELVSWDEPVEATGHEVPRVGLEDEESAGITLVEQGLDKADDNLRANVDEPEED